MYPTLSDLNPELVAGTVVRVNNIAILLTDYSQEGFWEDTPAMFAGKHVLTHEFIQHTMRMGIPEMWTRIRKEEWIAQHPSVSERKPNWVVTEMNCYFPSHLHADAPILGELTQGALRRIREDRIAELDRIEAEVSIPVALDGKTTSRSDRQRFWRKYFDLNQELIQSQIQMWGD